eukprot:sb/3463468/
MICRKTLIRIFTRRIHYVTAPKIPENAYLEDTLLPRLVTEVYKQRGECDKDVQGDLSRFGGRYRELNSLALQCEANPPKLQRLDGWGGRVDEITTCTEWKTLHGIASEEGIVAIGHEDKALREVWQSVKLILFGGVSGMVSCPLAMTDGAATTLTSLLHNSSLSSEDQWRGTLTTTLTHLTSRDPSQFWTSGQWMTERMGGSDVTRATETRAHLGEDGVYRLYGNKFYTSAIDCRVSLALARNGENLSLFLVHLPRVFDGTIEVEKLKNKMGTRQLPTAELSLKGLPGILLAEKGIANIIPMLQVTRLYNALTAASYLRHITVLARDFATKRSAFGQAISSLPLHRTSLARLEAFSRALTLQSVDLALVLNSGETPSLSWSVSRVLSAVVKVHTAHMAVTSVREGLECFGGAGYMEDTGLPGIFRDTCVLPVWEGTPDVLSAETARALSRGNARTDILRYLRELATGWCGMGGYQPYEDVKLCPQIEPALAEFNIYLNQLELAMERSEPHLGRNMTLALGSAHAAAVLINFANTTCYPSDVAAARAWCLLGLVPISRLDVNDVNVLLG